MTPATAPPRQPMPPIAAGRRRRTARAGAALLRPLGHIIAVGLGLLVLAAQPARAAGDGLITLPSAYSPDATIQRFEAAVRKQGWVVFGELDHAAAAKAVGLALDRRTVILFGSPRAGTPAMVAHPTLALDLPMRVLVWQDAQGKVFVTRSSGADIATRVFARHGVMLPQPAQDATEALLAGLVQQAAE